MVKSEPQSIILKENAIASLRMVTAVLRLMKAVETTLPTWCACFKQACQLHLRQWTVSTTISVQWIEYCHTCLGDMYAIFLHTFRVKCPYVQIIRTVTCCNNQIFVQHYASWQAADVLKSRDLLTGTFNTLCCINDMCCFETDLFWDASASDVWRPGM